MRNDLQGRCFGGSPGSPGPSLSPQHQAGLGFQRGFPGGAADTAEKSQLQTDCVLGAGHAQRPLDPGQDHHPEHHPCGLGSTCHTRAWSRGWALRHGECCWGWHGWGQCPCLAPGAQRGTGKGIWSEQGPHGAVKEGPSSREPQEDIVAVVSPQEGCAGGSYCWGTPGGHCGCDVTCGAVQEPP